MEINVFCLSLFSFFFWSSEVVGVVNNTRSGIHCNCVHGYNLHRRSMAWNHENNKLEYNRLFSLLNVVATLSFYHIQKKRNERVGRIRTLKWLHCFFSRCFRFLLLSSFSSVQLNSDGICLTNLLTVYWVNVRSLCVLWTLVQTCIYMTHTSNEKHHNDLFVAHTDKIKWNEKKKKNTPNK